jgi:exosortase/archaeosortase family protein
MLRFSIGYGVWAGLLFALFFVEGYSPLFAVNQLQTQLTTLITQGWAQMLALPLQIEGPTLRLPNGMNLHIVHECNGLVPFLLYLAAILAYPTGWKSKLLWALGGYVALQVINTLRMLLITLVVLEDKSLFHLAHDWVGRYAVALLTVALFFAFTHYVTVIQPKRSDLSRLGEKG